MALPKSLGIKLYDDTFVPVLSENEVKNKRVLLTTVKDNQKKAYIELYEGVSDRCSENEYLGKLTINIDRATQKGEPALEVHLRLDDDGVLYAKAWDQESKVESEIKIEHSSTKRIVPETLSDEELDNLNDSKLDITERYNDMTQRNYSTSESSSGNSGQGNVLIVLLIIALLLIILGVAGFFIYKAVTSPKKEPVKVIKEEPRVIEEPKIIEQPKEEVVTPPVIKTEDVAGIKKLEGKKHYIRWGDNLWNICKRYYKDPWYYPDLAKQNGIKNPRKIYAGTYIIIPSKSLVQRWQFLE